MMCNLLKDYLELTKTYKKTEDLIEELIEEKQQLSKKIDETWNQLTETERDYLRGND